MDSSSTKPKYRVNPENINEIISDRGSVCMLTAGYGQTRVEDARLLLMALAALPLAVEAVAAIHKDYDGWMLLTDEAQAAVNALRDLVAPVAVTTLRKP